MRKILLAVAMVLLSWVHAAPAQNYFCGTQICANPVHYLSAASNNSTNVKPAAGALYNIVAANTTATMYYLKLYDKATAPTCGTDIPVHTIPISPTPASGTPPPFVLDSTVGINFNSGIGFCLTGGIADADNTVAATGVAINFAFR